MLFSHQEYQQMFETEEQLWWYTVLHEKVLNEIRLAGFEPQHRILDMGCGTGGMLSFLLKNNFNNVEGFDYADSAVDFSLSRGLNVRQLDIDFLGETYKGHKFDIIICNDVFYSLSEKQIANAFLQIGSILNNNGIFISNNNAFNIFGGIHDYVLGGKQRFQIHDIKNLNQQSDLILKKYTYWSFFLSPLILPVRIFQKVLLKLKLVDLTNLKSDVKMPNKFLNGLFYKMVKLEEKVMKKAPFGSSLFTVFVKQEV